MPNRQETNKIVIHCAATKPSMDIGKEEITTWHIQRGFRTIGYHYVIRRDGEVEVGRSQEEIGAHALNHNKDSVGICLVGGLSEDNEAEENFTDIQWDILREVVEDLLEDYPAADVIGHNDISDKACPCFDVKEWRVKNVVASATVDSSP